jgi:lysozyme
MSWIDMAINLAKQFEGCVLTAYPDPASGGDPWTIGYGATGPGITQGVTWTQNQADVDLIARMTAIGARVDSLVTVDITDEQKGALCDFAYNLGVGALAGSTLLKMLNAGNVQGAADQFLRWDMASGKVMAGLEHRRDAERALFILGSNFAGA